MDEKKMKLKIRNLIIGSIVILLIVTFAGVGLANIMMNSFEVETKDSISKELDNYKLRIKRQVDNNFQLLDTLSGFIEISEFEEYDEFERAMETADSRNDFLMFGYFKKNGDGVVSQNKYRQKVALDSMQKEVQEVCRNNFEGNKSVSDSFIGNLSELSVFIYGVPVYRNGEVVGALVASDSVDAFSKEIGDKSRINGSGHVSLLDSTGDYIIRGDNAVIKKQPPTVFGQPYMNERDAAEAKRLVAEGKNAEFEFKYKGINYNGLIMPIGINDSCLLGINSFVNVNHNTFVIAYATAAFFIVIFIILFFLMFYGSRELKTGYVALKKIAYNDELTGIYNFRYLQEFCRELCETGEEFSISAINIRQFKFINDVFGIRNADKLLCHVANVLKEAVNENECVCRESADFFYMVLRTTNKDEIRSRIKDIENKIVNTQNSKNGGYRISIYGGIAVSKPNVKPQKIITEAMFAMARVRIEGSGSDWFFDEQIHERDRMDNFVENFAQEALENEEFKVYLQPKVELDSDKVYGAEALVRWIRPDGNIISPADFIPIFEKNGFCANLDMYMFEKVCGILREWLDEGITPVNISVNQSIITFYKEDYIENLSMILDKYKIPASFITLEILEGMAFKDIDKMNSRLDNLRKMGFIISMDDFGTGYSSLNILGRLKIDELKLDRSFLKEASETNNRNAALIMEEIVNLSKKLSIRTVVEGVETCENDRFIKTIASDRGQGFYYGKPMPEAVFKDKFLVKEVVI